MARLWLRNDRLGFAQTIRSRGAHARTALLALPVSGFLLGASCQAKWSGPYSCEPGYASCLSSGKNLCETHVTDDGLNCGACGKRCDLGGICKDGQCTPGASTLTVLPSFSSPLVAVNGSGVYWSSGSYNDIGRLSLDGQSMSIVTSEATGNGNSATPFAVDESYVYFWSNLSLARIPASGGNPTWFAPDSTGRPTPTALAVDTTRLVWLGYQNDSGQVLSVPLGGGATRVLWSFPVSGGRSTQLALTPAHALFVVGSQTGPPTLESVSVDGGNPVQIAAGGQYSLDAVVADASYAYVVGSSCSCNDNAADPGTRPRLTVARYALNGGGSKVLAMFSGPAASAALDDEFVYVATDTTLVKVPVAGGAPVILADNLDPARAPFLCTNCGSYSNTTLSIAVDSTSVYIADAAPTVSAIMKVKK
jgi:hypothetical protein